MWGTLQNDSPGAVSLNYVDPNYIFRNRQMPLGNFVVNQRFMAHFEKMDRNDLGGEGSGGIRKKGGEASALAA